MTLLGRVVKWCYACKCNTDHLILEVGGFTVKRCTECIKRKKETYRA